ncbi:MAG: hypothetical protein DRO76_02510 [Candidatus Altiarchaeales archaeon]|nr:MAG: hypothetical protein DRO76_02510 [Candidatus Altiarchaeales archaeon]
MRMKHKFILLVVVGILILILVSSGVMAEHCEGIGPYDTKLDDGDCHAVVYRYLSLELSAELYVKSILYKMANCPGPDKIEADSSEVYCGRCKITNKATGPSKAWEDACLEEIEELQTCADLGGEWCEVGGSCDGDDITSQASDVFSYPGQVCCDGTCEPPTGTEPCKDAGGYCLTTASCNPGYYPDPNVGHKYTDCALGISCCLPLTETCADLGGEWCEVGYECNGDDLTSQASDAGLYPGQVCCDGTCEEIPGDQPCKKAGGYCGSTCNPGYYPDPNVGHKYTDCAMGIPCCLPIGFEPPTISTTITTLPSLIVSCTCDCTTAGQTITITAHGTSLEECKKACAGICGGYTDCPTDEFPECPACCADYCSQFADNDMKNSCINACESICGLNNTIYGITEIIYYIAGIIAAIMFVIYGYKLITSTTPEERDDAKRGIMYVILALILIAVAGSLVNLLIGNIAHP